MRILLLNVTHVTCVTAASGYTDERTRYWSGYLLFYERAEETRGPVAAKKSRVTHMSMRKPEEVPS